VIKSIYILGSDLRHLWIDAGQTQSPKVSIKVKLYVVRSFILLWMGVTAIYKV